MKSRRLATIAGGGIVAALAILSACADTISAGFDSPQSSPVPSFDSPEAAAPPSTPAVAMCNSYECPVPYASCPDKPGLCTTNLDTDLANCGACGNLCVFADAGNPSLNAELSCDNGKCGVACTPLHGDCNHQYEDGCEADLSSDPLNCGACGIGCKAGEVCWHAACGCPPGYTQCGDRCTRLDKDPANCSACGNKCDVDNIDAGPGAFACDGGLPPNYGPACSNSTCKFDCAPGYGDCNTDRCGDGCETDLLNDPKNCGACGRACSPEQGCVSGECQCADAQFSFCGRCTDLMKDPGNCGACFHICPGEQPYDNGNTGRPICSLGRCEYACAPGHADCDNRPENGCEVDLRVDPQNCGACDVHCDLDGGQPCAAGRCLTKPCEGEDGGVN